MGSPPSAGTLPELLRAVAASTPAAEALVTGPTRWTYAELSGQADLAADVLAGLGVGAGDTVALLAPNIAAWVPVAVGAQLLGARVDAFNTWVKAYDLEHLLASSAASVLVLVDRVRNSDLLAELESLLPELATGPGWSSERFPALRHVVVVGERVPPGASSWAHLASAARPEPRVPAAHPDQPAFVLYTSGSTSQPKAVPLCHRDLVVNGFHIGERMGVTATDRVWFGSPLFWSFGCANALVNALSHGACFVLQEEFAPAAAAATMAAERVTVAYLLPAMVDALAGSVAAEVAAIGSLRTGATIGRPEEVARAVEDLGIGGMCNVYGATETYGNCCVTDHRTPVDVRVTTQGPPLPGVEVRVVDEAGTVLPPGEPGELQVRGRVTPGYLGDDAATAAAFTTDGWYRTGDRMLVRDDGAVSFVSRTTDMIKTSGINVSPAEVESFLAGHPEVVEVTVLGAAHPTRDQVVVAFVVARSGDLTAADLIAWSRARVAGYKVPWVAAVVDELPRTGTGKLARRTLQHRCRPGRSPAGGGRVTGNWGRWGADDEAGALNLVTPEVTRRALGLVRSGRTLSLAQPLGPGTPGPPHRHPPSRFMDRDAGDYALGARTPGGFRFAEDTVQFATHSGTHLDALSHAWSGEQLYNGHPQAGTRSTRGAGRLGADKLVPVLTRGVLVDLVTATGGPLPPRAPVTPADLERGIAEVGVEVEPGDAVLVRTGWWESHGDADDYFADEPGITEDAARWLAARDVAVVGADNYAVEQQSAEPGFPAHLVLLHQHGVPLAENVVLAELAGELAAQARSTFLLVLAPVPLVGSTGSPVTPVAVL